MYKSLYICSLFKVVNIQFMVIYVVTTQVPHPHQQPLLPRIMMTLHSHGHVSFDCEGL